MSRKVCWEFDSPGPDDENIRWAIIDIDDDGNVTASYELLAQLLDQLGGRETPDA